MGEESKLVLEVVTGPARGSHILTDGDALEVGRNADGEGTLGGEPDLSRRHARIQRTGDGRLLVEDLGSTNGTFVNGSRIGAPTLVDAGDEIEVGGTKLRAGRPAAAPAQAAAVPAAVPAHAAPADGPTQAARAAAPAQRRPALRVVAGFAPGALIPLESGPLTLGRRAAGAKALGGDADVADQHLRVSVTGDGRLIVEDLGSPGGTFVGDARIGAPTLVEKGQRLRVGGTTLEVVEAAAVVAQPSGVSHVLGGVREVPEGLFARIGARAPVTVKDVIPVFLVALGWAFAANLLVRTLAIEAADVSEDIDPLKLWLFIPATFMPVLGNSFGFFMSFRRPRDRSVVGYLTPAIAIPLAILVFDFVRLEHYELAEVLTTVAIVILPGAITVPLMLRLRARVARERVGAIAGQRRP